ncbi:GAF domain-containing protein [Ferruginibacter sp. SUN106]|uniref:sensor histidine kinase n=1 Tax=Ferruginibacter sp. SUN106 TaxID=2978348 RepID=UPI003D36A465
MIIAELPPDEELRLIDLASYEITDSPEENDFNELVELAAQICNCPISLITLLDKNQQWFKAKKGIAENNTARDVAFCTHAILQDEVMEVEDATKDERFFDNPFVTGEHQVRFYAGAPIVSTAGYKLGTICIIDNQPRKLLPEQERALKILSNQVTKLLELRKKNLLIRKRAAEMIALKTKTISRVILAQEINKKEIAYNLHEELAQSLASAMMFLKMAANGNMEESQHWKTAQEQLRKVLTGIRELSYAITPPVMNFIPAEELVKEFVERVAATFSFTIRTVITGKKTSYTGDKAIAAIRIIEQWLKVLADNKNISIVTITIQTGMPFEILIEDDGPVLSFNEVSKEVFNSLLFEVAQSYNGTVEHTVSAASANAIKISFSELALAVA